jgi:hypothetical protein
MLLGRGEADEAIPLRVDQLRSNCSTKTGRDRQREQ